MHFKSRANAWCIELFTPNFTNRTEIAVCLIKQAEFALHGKDCRKP